MANGEAMARALMLQGTGSNVGKSLIVAGLCRAFANRGLKVAPFKPQNMSNNAAVTSDGGEIGRAQAMQARAARIEPVSDMNPILLKPEGNGGAQIILQGRRSTTLSARDYFANRDRFRPAVLESFRRLAATVDLVVVEGAGSPAEINLRDGDLANMGFARAANVPVILIGDIHRGGVIASLVGTFVVLDPADAALIRAFLVNNFHGDPTLFDDGRTFIEGRTGVPCLGVIPHWSDARKLPAEDSLALDNPRPAHQGPLRIAVLRLARIANFDDLDPLGMEPGVKLVFVKPGEPIPAEAEIIILPGSKSTIGDLIFLRAQGWDVDIKAHVRRGGHVLGLCGGYQMLGKTIDDPDGVDGRAGTVEGLGLLDIATVMTSDKSTTLVTGTHCASGAGIEGYEIHLGRSQGRDCARPLLDIDGRADGAISADGRVQGTYVHGLFTGDAFRKAWLAQFGIASSLAYEARIESALDALADHLEAHLDIEQILKIARSRQATSASAA
jgi:adenosylcobyric acid synthase